MSVRACSGQLAASCKIWRELLASAAQAIQHRNEGNYGVHEARALTLSVVIHHASGITERTRIPRLHQCGNVILTDFFYQLSSYKNPLARSSFSGITPDFMSVGLDGKALQRQ